MESYAIKITEQAFEHLQNIKDYIANDLLVPETADRIMHVLEKEIRSLSEMPHRIKLTEEEPWHSRGIRKMRVKNYYVYFWFDEKNNRVQIIAIIYTSRDQLKQLGQL